MSQAITYFWPRPLGVAPIAERKSEKSFRLLPNKGRRSGEPRRTERHSQRLSRRLAPCDLASVFAGGRQINQGGALGRRSVRRAAPIQCGRSLSRSISKQWVPARNIGVGHDRSASSATVPGSQVGILKP